MREYVFTEEERKVLNEFLQSGSKSDVFYVLLSRIRRNCEALRGDLALLEEVLEKAERKTNSLRKNEPKRSLLSRLRRKPHRSEEDRYAAW